MLELRPSCEHCNQPLPPDSAKHAAFSRPIREVPPEKR